MLTQVIIQSSSPMTLDVEDVNPNEILILKSISGLSLAKTTLFTGEFARDGGYYQGRRAGTLNPVFTFRVNPNYHEDIEVSDVREILYRTFMEPFSDSDAVQVTLKDDRRPDRYFHGYTESVEADLFEKNIAATVSMISVDPYLRSVDPTIYESVGGWFSLPIRYDGSADVGVKIQLKVLSPIEGITVEALPFSMILSRPFQFGDVIDINTEPGSRSIRVNGVDAMSSLVSVSKWIRLTPNTGRIRVFGEQVDDGAVSMVRTEYRSAWWGI